MYYPLLRERRDRPSYSSAWKLSFRLDVARFASDDSVRRCFRFYYYMEDMEPVLLVVNFRSGEGIVCALPFSRLPLGRPDIDDK